MSTLTPAAITAAQRQAAELSRTMPGEAAAAWVHASALAVHATHHALIPGADTVIGGLEQLAEHPALAGLTDPTITKLWGHPLPAPAQRQLLDLWTHHRVHDDPFRTDGYRLGDLYQAVSAEARFSRALCQTPKYVTDLLLKLSVDQAAVTWPGEPLKVIDPACGTGHILIETLIHLYAGRRLPAGELLGAVHGCDIDPYAVQIARYRLLAMASRLGGSSLALAAAPRSWTVQVAAADSLLDTSEPVLARGQYHAVLANPPYFTVKDPAANAAIRAAWPQVTSGKYSLALPFSALCTELARPGGWIAQLTSNAFMKREYGRKYIEEYLSKLDLRWVIDTSGVYIPGHGTPTVILVHRQLPKTTDPVRTILGKRGEPRLPADPAKGLVWTAIVEAVDHRLAYENLNRHLRHNYSSD